MLGLPMFEQHALLPTYSELFVVLEAELAEILMMMDPRKSYIRVVLFKRLLESDCRSGYSDRILYPLGQD